MEEIDIHAKLAQIETAPHFSMIFDGDTEKAEMIAEHLMWLHSIRRERPLVSRPSAWFGIDISQGRGILWSAAHSVSEWSR